MSAEKLKLEVLLSAIDRVTGPLKAITRGSGEAAKALRAAKDQLKDIEGQQKAIAAFKAADKAAAITANAFKGVQEQVKNLQREMAKTPEPTQAMIKALKAAQSEAETLKSRHAGLMDTQQRLFSQMRSGGIDVNNLAHHSRDLSTRQVEAAQSAGKLSAALDAQNLKLKRLHAARADYEKSMAFKDKLAGAGGKAMMAGAAINAAAAIPVLAYAKAEDSATQLKIAMMQAGGKVGPEFKQINDLAEKLGNKLPGTTSDFQDMMTMLIRQGMPAKTVLGGLGEATAYLAVQLKMAPAAAAEFASELQHATRTTDRDMMALMDTIQKAFNLGVNQNHMLEGFAKMSPILSIIKKEGSEAAQILAPLLVMAKNAGMAGESAGNAYRKIFQQSMNRKKMAKGNAELAGTGIHLDFTDGKGEFGGLDKMYAQLEKLKGVNTVQRLAALNKIFGDDAETLQAVTLMIEKGAHGYAAVQAKMEAQANIQERVNAQLKTLANLWDAASGTFTNALVALGESISPELHATAEWLGTVAEKTQRWAKENPGLAAGLMHIVKWSGLAALGIGGLLIAASAILAPLAMFKFGLAALGPAGATGAAGVWALLRPVLMVGAAFTAGYAAGTVLNAGIDWLVSKMLGHKTTLGAAIFDLVEIIKAKFGEMTTWLGTLPARFMAAGAAIVDGIMTGISSRWEALKATVTGLADSTVGWLKDKLGIRSPSRVFAEIGGYTMEGFEQGILGGQGGPLAALMDVSKRLTAAAGAGMMIGGAALAGELPAIDTRPAMAPMAAMAGMMAPLQVTINIYPTPGQSPEDIGREVARQIQQLDNQRAARQRSRLVDEA
jgi:TP901 family phage tail tape measure protein